MLIQGPHTTPEFLYSLGVNQLLVGEGDFSCCNHNHIIGGRSVPCDKRMLRRVLERMLDEKIDALYEQGGTFEVVEARFLAAARQWYLKGLEPDQHLPQQAARLASECAPCAADFNHKECRRAAEVLRGRLRIDSQTRESLSFPARFTASFSARFTSSSPFSEATVQRTTGWSVLHYAAMAGDLAAATHSIAHGANVNLATKHGAMALGWGRHLTPLHLAMSYASFDMVELLLNARANPHVTEGSTKYTVVMRAAWFGQSDNLRRWMLRFPSYPIDRRNAFGNNALHVACFVGTRKRETVRLLLDSKCDPRSPNYACVTPLIAAVYNADDSEALIEILTELRSSAATKSKSSASLHLAADVNARAWPRGAKMSSIFALARFATYTGSENKLLRWLASYPGITALHVAAATGNMVGARSLLAAHADATIVNKQGLTPLTLASASFGGEVPLPLASLFLSQPFAAGGLEGADGSSLHQMHSAMSGEHASHTESDTGQQESDGDVREHLKSLSTLVTRLTLSLDEMESERAADKESIAALVRHVDELQQGHGHQDAATLEPTPLAGPRDSVSPGAMDARQVNAASLPLNDGVHPATYSTYRAMEQLSHRLFGKLEQPLERVAAQVHAPSQTGPSRVETTPTTTQLLANDIEQLKDVSPKQELDA